MKRAIIYTALILGLFVACKAQKIEQSTMRGTFYKLKRGDYFSFAYTLELKADSTFQISIRRPEGTSDCTGKWKIVDNAFVLLSCNEDDNPDAWMQNGYMNLKEYRVKIISKDKIEYREGVVLKRKKPKP